jgi:hypothetical protein
MQTLIVFNAFRKFLSDYFRIEEIIIAEDASIPAYDQIALPQQVSGNISIEKIFEMTESLYYLLTTRNITNQMKSDIRMLNQSVVNLASFLITTDSINSNTDIAFFRQGALSLGDLPPHLEAELERGMPALREVYPCGHVLSSNQHLAAYSLVRARDNARRFIQGVHSEINLDLAEVHDRAQQAQMRIRADTASRMEYLRNSAAQARRTSSSSASTGSGSVSDGPRVPPINTPVGTQQRFSPVDMTSNLLPRGDLFQSATSGHTSTPSALSSAQQDKIDKMPALVSASDSDLAAFY